MKFLTSAQIREAESKIIKNTADSLRLIDNAAKACVGELASFGASCVFCGKGNNGADGRRLALLLKKAGKKVRIVSVSEPKTPECRALAEECLREGIPSQGLDGFRPSSVTPDTAIVDAIFGIGIHGEVTGEERRAIETINALANFTLCIDVPSGLDADSGKPCAVAVRADKTVTFTAPKTGMAENESVEYCGEIVVREAGIPVNYELFPTQPAPLVKSETAPLLPKRPRLSHKGTFGRLLMIVGSKGMLGAGAIAAKAAMRSGCGLVTIVCAEGLENTVNCMVPEAVVLPVREYSLEKSEKLRTAVTSANAVLIGCGLGKSVTADFIGEIIGSAEAPVIIDADGLNILAGRMEPVKNKNVILTPHPLEFSRLTGKSVGEIESARIAFSRAFAEKNAVTLVLKGARTVIAEKNGCASVSLCSTSALARGGSGDVLAGMISALCAQGLSPESGAKLGVYLHGRSGMLAAEKASEYSVTINDILENIKFAFMEAENYEQPWKGMGGNQS